MIKILKNIIVLILTIFMLFSFTACIIRIKDPKEVDETFINADITDENGNDNQNSQTNHADPIISENDGSDTNRNGSDLPKYITHDGVKYMLDENEEYTYTDKNGVEWILVELFGEDTGSIWDWMTAEMYYIALYGEDYFEPVQVDGTIDRLAGYPVKQQQNNSDWGDDDDWDNGDDWDGGNNDYNEFTTWPAEALPQGTPRYPDGRIEGYAEPGYVTINIYDTSAASFTKYLQSLKNAGWDIRPDDDEEQYGYAGKDDWEMNYGIWRGEEVCLTFYVLYEEDW
jgi:hypothetical protein